MSHSQQRSGLHRCVAHKIVQSSTRETHSTQCVCHIIHAVDESSSFAKCTDTEAANTMQPLLRQHLENLESKQTHRRCRSKNVRTYPHISNEIFVGWKCQLGLLGVPYACVWTDGKHNHSHTSFKYHTHIVGMTNMRTSRQKNVQNVRTFECHDSRTLYFWNAYVRMLCAAP